MGQPALQALVFRIDSVAAAPRAALAEWRAALARRLLEPARIVSGRNADDEAAYCLARADVEVRRAGETTHSAARAAHLEMAVLYRQRAIAVRQAQSDEIRNWVNEGGSFLAGD